MTDQQNIESELSELRTEIASLRKRRHGLRVVVGAVALLSVTGIGTASALTGKNTVFSDDITDGNVKTPDLAANAVTSPKIKDGSVGSADVGTNALTGNDINEGTLQPYLASKDVAGGNCFADSASQDCATLGLTTKGGAVFIQGDGTFDTSANNYESGVVELVVDGTTVRSLILADSTTAVTDTGFSISELVPVGAGHHTVILRFTEGSGVDPDLHDTHLTAFQVG